MMLTWMIATVAFTLFVGVAAAATERLLRAFGHASRGPWILALAIAVTWPVLVPMVRPLVSPDSAATQAAQVSAGGSADALHDSSERNTLWTRVIAIGHAFDTQMRRVSELFAAHTSSFNTAVLLLWVTFSAALLLRLLLAAIHVRRLTQSASPMVVDGTTVLLAEGFGPASVGWRSPRVVIPQWVLALDKPLRALVLRHEAEHCVSRDPRFVWCAAVATSLMPWNAGLWWIARRLRLALELDCDVRTLRNGGDPRMYAKLLLFMTQQHAAPVAHLRLASSLASTRSHLAQRISAMQQKSMFVSRSSRMITGCVAALAVIAACNTQIPGNVAAPDEQISAQPQTSAAVASTDAAPASVQPAAGNAYFEFQVEKPVSMRSGAGLTYPPLLRSAGIEGTVLASFVVDDKGVPDMSTFEVLRSDHELFSYAVRTAIRNIEYEPAEIGGKHVRQLVQQPFVFQIAK